MSRLRSFGLLCCLVLTLLLSARPGSTQHSGGCACGGPDTYPWNFELELGNSSWDSIAIEQFQRWNTYANVFSWEPGDGRVGFGFRYGFSYPNEVLFAGDELKYGLYGTRWGQNTLAVAASYTGLIDEVFENTNYDCSTFDPDNSYCPSFEETDVVLNVSRDWTKPFRAQATLLHEFGHALGHLHDFHNLSALNYIEHDAQRYLSRADTRLLRNFLRVQGRSDLIRNVTDLATYPFLHNGGYKWDGITEASVDKVQAGEMLRVRDITVENIGTRTLSDVRLNIYLSTNDTISTSDYHLGRLRWDSFSTWWDGQITIPTATVRKRVPPGFYYIGAIVSYNTDQTDSVTYNNSWVLPRQIRVTGLPDDETPSFGPGTYSATLTVGTPVNLTLPAATGGDGALSYSLSPLPAGLSFNSQTRVLSGTPTTAQAATAATYTVTDGDATDPDTDTRTFTITILDVGTDPPVAGILGEGGAGSGGGEACTTGFSSCVSAAYHAIAEGTSADGGWCHLWGAGTSQAEADQNALAACQNACTCRITGQWAGPSCVSRADSPQQERYAWAASTDQTQAESRALELCRQSGSDTGDLAQGVLENPGDQSAQSGIGVLSGWVCEATTVEFEVKGVRYTASYGTERLDSGSVCGDTNNGFGLLFNWNRLGDGTHPVRLLVDGEEFATATVRVTTLGEEFRRGLQGETVLRDFPSAGQDSRLVWQEAQQNFVLAVGPVERAGSHRDPAQAVLENPSPGSYQSGVRLLSGWVCEAAEVVLELDGVYRLTAGYGTERPDTLGVCGDTNNGFGLLFNWSRLSDGPHTVRLLVDGAVYASATFAVTTLGEEFRRGLAGRYTVEDFPGPGQRVTVEWQEAQQNFVIIAVE